MIYRKIPLIQPPPPPKICNPVIIPTYIRTPFLLLTLSLTLRILKSLLLTWNIFHIFNDVKYAEIRALYWKKEKKVISLTGCKPPSPPKIGPSNLSFVPIYAQDVMGFYGS